MPRGPDGRRTSASSVCWRLRSRRRCRCSGKRRAPRSAGGEVVARKSGEHRHRLRARDRFPRLYVPFVRSANRRTITLYYDTEEALRKAGVLEEPPMPIPFPDSQEFAPPPPGYKGH